MNFAPFVSMETAMTFLVRLTLGFLSLGFCVVSIFICPAEAADGRFIGDKNGNVLIIFVHGIGGSADGTWKSDTANWPDLVKSDPQFEGVSVYVYNYESSLIGRSPSIPELSRDLRDHLMSEAGANITAYPKVIFVAHSLGGLIVRHYLLEDSRQHRNIAGLFLFAAPMAGSYYAKLARAFSSTVKEMQTNGVANAFVGDLRDSWLERRPPISIDSWCAYERLPIGPLSVVTPDSAIVLCNRAARSDSAANHQTLVKPKGLDDPKHQFLQAWFNEALPLRDAKTRHSKEDVVFANCSESFYGSDMQSAMVNIAAETGHPMRLSERLPVDYIPAVRSLLWQQNEPKVLVIHLSCFERRPSTVQSMAERTDAFIRLLKDLRDVNVRIIVYSRAFRTDPNFMTNYVPKELLKQYQDKQRLFTVPIDSNRLFSTDEGAKKRFRNTLLNAQKTAKSN